MEIQLEDRGNLFAFACKESYEKGFDGVVSFYAKTKLIVHYSVTLGPLLFSNNKMVIPEKYAYLLEVLPLPMYS